MIAAPGAPNLIMNSYSAEVVKRNQKESSAWMHAAANLQLLRIAALRLDQIGRKRDKLPLVKHVRAGLVEGTRRVVIFPTPATDPDAIPVSYYRGSAWINLISLLGPAGIMVEPGTRELYAVGISDESSPYGPALEINLDRMLERRSESKTYKNRNVPAPTEAE